VGEEEIEATLRAADDGGAAIGRVAEERGIDMAAGTPLRWRAGIEGGDTGGDAAERAVREGKWAEAAWAAVEAGDPMVAEGWARQGLAIRGARVVAAGALAVALRRLSRLAEAAEVIASIQPDMERAAGVVQGWIGEEVPTTAQFLRDSSAMLLAQGDLAGARERIERALGILVKVYGTDEHPDVAASLRALARVLREQGDLSGARERLERALRIQVKVYGTDEHPDVAASLRELARVLREQGDLSGARERLERAIRIQANVYGTEEHPGVTASLHDLSGVLVAQGDLASARETLERALAMGERVYRTREHSSIALIESLLGRVLLQLGERERSLDLLRHAHATLIAHLGPAHPDTRDVADVLSRVNG
jgi:tetratricopeptide (TPR) repeat protein